MKRTTVIAAAATFGMAIGGWTAAAWIASAGGDEAISGRFAGPHVVLPTRRCDLGTVPPNVPLVARFVIQNHGSRRLIIHRQDAACCGASDQDEMTMVWPGKQSELVVQFEAGRENGHLERTVTYTTNDQEMPRFELTVSANIL